jgi:LPS O-antigen subunit length determinant protein (WzzB/FepE family)
MSLMLLFDATYLDKLPSDLRGVIVNHTKLFKDKAILPLVDADPATFEIRLAQAEKDLLSLMNHLFMLVNSRYTKGAEISSNFVESFLLWLDQARKEYSKFGREPITLTMLDAIDVFENYIKQSSASTFTLNVEHYRMGFQYYTSASVCVIAMDVIKKDDKPTKDKITDLLIEKCQENTSRLNDLVTFIQTEEDKQAIIQGRLDYAEGRVEKFSNVDELLKSLEAT